MVVYSPKFSLKIEDVEKSLKNALIFLAPVLIVAIPSLVGQIPSDFKYAALLIWGLNFILDLLRKFVGENKYVVKK